MVFLIQPIQLLKALSMALELSTDGVSRHHWRTAMIADRIATYTGMPDQEKKRLVYATLLHDIGAASSWEEKRRLLLFEADGTTYSHAEAGYLLLKNSPQLGVLAESIRHHHDAWEGSSPSGLAGKQIPLASRIIFLADRIDVLLRDDKYVLDQRADILSSIREFSGVYFDPVLVKAVHELARQESFWLDLFNPQQYQSVSSYDEEKIRLTTDDMIGIAEIFATIIDRMSRFTVRHSRTVAQLAGFLARQRGYSEEESKMLQVAGLLHDLGKLAVPNYILEKPDKLTDKEFSIIKQHAYYTYHVLKQIDGFGEIAEWAAYHHETLDGTGYPFHIKERELKLGSRIVAVADVFAALAEDRPYRPAMEFAEIAVIMRSMADNRKIDRQLVSVLLDSDDTVYAVMNKKDIA